MKKLMSNPHQNILGEETRHILQLDEVYRKNNVLQQWLKDLGIRERSWDSAIQCLKVWTMIQESVSEYVLYREKEALIKVQDNIEHLISNFARLVLFTPGQLISYKDEMRCVVDITFDSYIYRYQGFERSIPCIIPLSTQPSPNEFEAVLSKINEMDWKDRLVIVLVLGTADSVRYLQTIYADYKIILIDEHDFKSLLFSEDAKKQFCQIVVRDIDCRTIQPYSHVGIRSSMFVGRDVEIYRILANPGQPYVIFGPRRIGKTFLMMELERKIKADSDYKIFYFSCMKNKIDSIKHRLLRAISTDTIEKLEDHFEDCFRNLIAQSNKKLVFMLDEIDDLVDEDKKHSGTFFSSLRNINNEFKDKCRFIFAGFQILAEETHNKSSPFYNFAHLINLGPLSEKDAIMLIVNPLEEELFFTLQDKDDMVSKIIEKTMRHPALIQFTCTEVIRKACEEDRKIITLEDIDAVFEDYDYRSQVNKSFWNELSKMQQIFALLMLKIEKEVLSNEIRDSLEVLNIHLSIDEVEGYVVGMIAAGIVVEKDHRYSFSNTVLSEMISRGDDTDLLLLRFRKDLDARSSGS